MLLIFPQAPTPLLATASLSSLSVVFVVCLDSTQRWDHTAFVFLRCISLSVMLSSSIHTIARGRISVCVYTVTFSLFIHSVMDTWVVDDLRWWTFFMYYLVISFVFSGKIPISDPLPLFKPDWFFYRVLWVLFVFWIGTPYQVDDV